jgi:AbrB family looped-hinge helix DNA binding protein
MALTAKVSIKGQIVIPGQLRKKHHLEPGTQVDVYEYGDVICIAPRPTDPIAAACGILPSAPSLAQELLLERQKDEAR